ncbi:hypothetical protein T440DRAFT_554108 [Plenodomus tracheiphilus IPT5]|uniref:DUF3500 domain-containing protein n=1 Tax=Plenodomus tracheiphilus IPT5 TaxID=1408161 RepID=A0A6A7B8U9_9PLEO|nr:hypothetical protein T440DRAFT_554108 [Plenodomus tracheiphilus IPT5]
MAENVSNKKGSRHEEGAFRKYIPAKDLKRSQELSASNTYQWCDLRCAEPFIQGWKKSWESLSNETYKGITTDGNVIPGLYPIAHGSTDHGAPTDAMMKAALHALSLTTNAERAKLNQPIDAPEWRRWSNPEIYIYRHGLRLEEISQDLVTAIYDVMRASLSPEGYTKARGCMRVNQFLGEVVDGKGVLNEKSYNFTIYGTPSIDSPWGWQIYGHHFDMNCFVLGTQMVVSPIFMGAEPNIIDAGPYAGTQLFVDQERLALELMRTMDESQIKNVRIFKELSGPEYPEGRFHRADQRHLGGAFQDNRIIPYEGLGVSNLTQPQQDMVRRLIILFVNYLPAKALKVKMEEVLEHWKNTYFCWIGGFGEQDAFYFKVHSPVIMVEFDHHTGVFLNNKIPLPFHIHTLVRTPNGNDYGKAILKQWQERTE